MCIRDRRYTLVTPYHLTLIYKISPDVYKRQVNDSNDDMNNVPRDNKLASRCSVLRATINNCIGNVLTDSGAKISLINENFINKNIVKFKKAPILPINHTTIKTATDKLQQTL